MALITNSDRQLLKATYRPIEVDQSSDKVSQAHIKAALVRGLQFQSGEVDAVRGLVGAGASQVPDTVWTTIKKFEPQPIAALMPKASALADIPVAQLQIVAKAALDHRTASLAKLDEPPPPAVAGGPTPAPAVPGVGAGPTTVSAVSVRAASSSVAPATSITESAIARPAMSTGAQAQPSTVVSPPMAPQASVPATSPELAIAPQTSLTTAQRATALSLVTFAQGALETFTSAVQISPIGMLNLERIEMSPAGIERGELVATIPMAPGETTSVSQKEWSVTSQDFSSIVTDYLENYSEKGVTEKSELAQSSESQTKQSQQMGLDASVSGSYGFVTFATSAKFDMSVSDDETKKQSRSDAKEVTSKASSRSRKEHKVTIQVSSTVGKEETSTRTLTNPSTTSSMRIDYFSMMRKWRVRLLQYGLRLTYDLAIPEPGATLREAHAELARLNQLLGAAFTFQLDPTSITDGSYTKLASDSGVALQGPPPPTWSQLFSQTLEKSKDASATQTLEFDVKDGYAITSLTVGGWGSPSEDTLGFSLYLAVPPTGMRLFVPINSAIKTTDIEMFTNYDVSGQADVPVTAFDGQSGHISIPFMQDYMSTGMLYASVHAQRTDQSFWAWQQQTWQALHDAARDAYYTQLQALTQRRDALQAKLEGVDTLTLRREELDEVMKGVLRWLLGPDFDFMPPDVVALFTGPTGQSFTGNDLGLNAAGWTTMFIYQEMVKFIQQAIEWENMLYFGYPYFWDVPTAWDFARTLEHPDPARQAFLRAGSARVVLTIRSGYEEAFTAFVERGELGQVLPPDHPYLTIGQEIRAYDQTNYPGIPPANPDQEPRPLLTPLQRKAWQDMQIIMTALDSYNTKNGRYPTTGEGLASLSGLATIPTSDPWGHPYVYKSPGAYNNYDLASLGADGAPGGDGENADITSWADSSLIAEWFEYTPSHGLDIAVTSDLTTMS